MVIKIILSVLVMLTAVPAGLFLAWLCKDELVKCRKYFIAMIYFMAVLASIGKFLLNFGSAEILSMIYLSIALFTMVLKSRKS